MAESLHVKKRTDVGSRASLRLRRDGKLPAVLYGHNEPSVSLTLGADQLSTALRHGAKVVELAGDEKGQALLQDLQWDTFGRYVLHADLLRIKAGEKVTVEIEVTGKGEAPGEAEGGMVTWVNHSVEIEVAPADIPDHLLIDMTKLAAIGDGLTAADIQNLPAGATLVTPAETLLVHCVAQAMEAEADEEGTATGAEPEVISQKSDGDEAAESE